MVKTFEFDDDGLVSYFKADMTQYPWSAWERFTSWVTETHPEQRQLLEASGRQFNYSTDPAVALQLLEEYGAYLDGT